MNQYTETYKLVTGPIEMRGNDSWLSEFQQLDIMGTMAGTYYGIRKNLWYSANAANMIFDKSLYLDFQQQFKTHHASGDDMFLIQWAAKNDFPVGFVRHPKAIVTTEVENDFDSFWQQRLRWASKTKSYTEKGLIKLMAGVWLFNLSILLNCVLLVFLGAGFLKLALLQVGIKYFCDLQFFKSVGVFFNKEISSLRTLILSILHTVYIVAIGITTPFVATYNWKGRKER